MKRHAIIISYILVALVIAWSWWAWNRWPSQRAQTQATIKASQAKALYEAIYQKGYDDGYTWAGAEPDPAVFMKGIDAYFETHKP